jgi:hypothetical protein
MAEVRLAPAPTFNQDHIESAPDNGADFLSKKHRQPIYVPSYENGIAVPPTLECVCGKNCKTIDEHHNAFDGPYYRKPPGIRKEASKKLIELFRGSRYNRFWVARCGHIALQATGQERAKRPNLEIIEGFVEESAILLDLDKTSSKINATKPRGMSNDWLDKCGISYEERLERLALLQEKRDLALRQIGLIRVIPEEVVTGALLYSAPDIAKQRLAGNPEQRILSPISWPKNKISFIYKRAQSMNSLQTGVDRVQLAA